MFGKNRTPLQNHCRCKVPIPARKVDERALFEGGHSETDAPLKDAVCTTNDSVIEMGNYITTNALVRDDACLEAGRP